MEYVRVRFSPLPAGFALSRGSSFSRESFREEAMPEREEDADDGKSSGSESASEASSRESRPGSCKGFWISENPRRDMTREGASNKISKSPIAFVGVSVSEDLLDRVQNIQFGCAPLSQLTSIQPQG